MTDTTNPLPKVPKPDEGSGVCLTPENPDQPDATSDATSTRETTPAKDTAPPK
jgi:hypothetical protein